MSSKHSIHGPETVFQSGLMGHTQEAFQNSGSTDPNYWFMVQTLDFGVRARRVVRRSAFSSTRM